MKILYLPIDINLSNISIPEVDFKNLVDGKYQPYWNTFKITDKNLKYKINFTGGEISLNKSFLSFIKWLRKNYNDRLFQVGLSTNGSAQSKYYLELIEYVDFITFSTHSEFFNEKKFFENVLACKTKIQGTEKTIQVSVMNEPWHAERIKTYIEFFNLQNISYSLNEIDFNMKTRDKHKINKNKNLYNFNET
jgi:pyruvate-formate lyase-activating enzyme